MISRVDQFHNQTEKIGIGLVRPVLSLQRGLLDDEMENVAKERLVVLCECLQENANSSVGILDHHAVGFILLNDIRGVQDLLQPVVDTFHGKDVGRQRKVIREGPEHGGEGTEENIDSNGLVRKRLEIYR